jgi:hypothetical protein
MQIRPLLLTPEEVMLVWSPVFDRVSQPKSLTLEERVVAERLMDRLDAARGCRSISNGSAQFTITRQQCWRCRS